MNERQPSAVALTLDPAEQAALDSEIREALRAVVDPEINIDVVTLGLIRDVVFHPAETEIQMILTTPFCPYAGSLIQQIKDTTHFVTGNDVRVTLLDTPPWSPDRMSDDARDQLGIF